MSVEGPERSSAPSSAERDRASGAPAIRRPGASIIEGAVQQSVAADEGPFSQKGRAARHSAVATCRTARASLMGPSQLNAVLDAQEKS
jgi:hypothetical protein